MKVIISKFYEDLYRNSRKSKYIFGSPEKELVNFLKEYNFKIRAKIVDLGCGDGRNTIFLASRNFCVTGIDKSIHALKKLRKYIKDSKLAKNISLKRANLKTIKLKEHDSDMIICVQTFHEIGNTCVRRLIKQAKLSTKPLGINYLAFFLPKKGTYMRKECYYPDELTIIKQYKCWKILKRKKILIYQYHATPYSKGKKIKHKHYVCQLFLQKPK